MDFVAVHAGDFKAGRGTGRIQHGVVAGALAAEPEIITHQHVAHLQACDQHVFNEGGRALRGQTGVKGQHHGLVDAAACQLGELVAQGRDAGGSAAGGEVFARMRLKGHHSGRQAAVLGFVFEHSQHGLVATVHPVKVADGQRAGLGQRRVLMAAKDFHIPDYRFLWRAIRAAGMATGLAPGR